MPWCDPCSEYHAPTALDEGRCPSCGGEVSDGLRTDEPPSVGTSAPWHFWVVVALLALYLTWRLVGFILWIFG